ncbi:hypothetical protein ACW2QC_08135 [Virgibacillus sp. FSP13]
MVGADGHPITDEFTFEVDAPIEETAQQEEQVLDTVEKEQSIPTFLTAGVLVIFVIGLVWWLLRRK